MEGVIGDLWQYIHSNSDDRSWLVEKYLCEALEHTYEMFWGHYNLPRCGTFLMVGVIVIDLGYLSFWSLMYATLSIFNFLFLCQFLISWLEFLLWLLCPIALVFGLLLIYRNIWWRRRILRELNTYLGRKNCLIEMEKLLCSVLIGKVSLLIEV